ncbi:MULTISPECIES: DivIVA domain-containing protein [unclassified Rothia (in: high G+C Gram-positive bacteria)]|uniref:DivIVA domain-containing protein n=1 Tax=unclassified Rothia (in: high G+C Gram-positive bacteria) TaxID=2689056 RepID=UPI0019565424|nr:DivIVA domain-containing protein [Rothia sp. ZJ932]MBM7051330.1 DivIVA domain-containing protein [Rothia sp. ZJ1223]QRZ61120.1 DivIVA domain-containing protein [Rothia sp. ZJ932]
MQKRISEFALAKGRKVGYSVEAVDEYFDELANDYESLRAGESASGGSTARSIRMKSFPPAPGGYCIEDVDSALDRVEDRFAAIERRGFIAEHGMSAWSAHIEQLAETIMGRLQRPAGQRFRHPSKKLTKGYLIADVDSLCQQLATEFKMSDDVDVQLIRGAVFRSATGAKSYDETQVDAFLDRCLDLMHYLK